ncbi:hypothetical protein NDI56_04600 [Haloarcula sp. S1CR25-12]|uniref:Uncharacterized protein n=1 Tax=Haloarcula saliterrae TaxID=2950534 RepID=A0ABU2F8V7_9EURY|nr:hypothetical protein [Haloarcula sp. S1CR25-12]MDS0258689.1 hypothetical protein [Haloarcula sp. S1CR25-12]
MTQVQQVLFELESDYQGHAYHVTGNALFNALARRVDARARKQLQVSHGVFVPSEYGEYPSAHSEVGYAGVLGKSLPAVENYADLFLYRDAAQRWLLDSRPRDAHNVPDIQSHGGRLAFAPRCWFGRPENVRNSKRSVQWFVQCYVHGGHDDDVLPLDDDVLDGLRVGAARNYGLGELSLKDTQLVELDELDYSRVEDTALNLELVSPFVLESEYPGADGQDVPWWWGVDGELRRRETRLVNGEEVHVLETVDHGQVVDFAGTDAVRTAKNGVLRVGTHAKYGFGEFRLRPAKRDRVPERAVGVGGATS